ncbi:globin domain-containing protein [Marinactinospora thermotolerans]|uniref:Hemoglobin-like flavoprotein n=1 Tax=Marinactinospora thermotolerans DSM 45154 TaxID=1122192 RepID=A0A1T4TGD9_9ACTN|nr:globin domain-containing protein [Marinactinospora thermotolerans]SKA39289.1 Hemoglobin-like flavoprotein [Marinactinospora thermotolerans DSM 45154]
MQPRPISSVPLPDAKAIDDVRLSCADLPEDSVELAERFYDHLFELVPEIRSMFSKDMGPQHLRMSRALLGVIRHLDQPEEVQEELRRLGARHHTALGVKPEHYPYVGRAMVRAVSELSPTWSSRMSSSWVTVYEWIAASMMSGAETAQTRGDESAPARAARPLPPRYKGPEERRESVPAGQLPLR